MKLYLSAKLGSKKRPLASELLRFVDRLEEDGHEITYPWWKAAWLPVRPEAHWELSSEIIAGIVEADALVLIPPDQGGVGCFLETGFAMGLKKDVHLVRFPGIRYYGRESSFFHNEDLVTEWKQGHQFLSYIRPRA